TLEEEEPYEPLRADPTIERAQADRLARLRAERDGDAVHDALAEIRSTAAGSGNVLVPLKAALAARATVGEVCDALREVWGTYTPRDAF
ncbi:MAG TPA: methylmalonyl-CoA mutase family protein, partial [Microlunatus sp.]|nr:methylmalonyl-CoA mutase family protein [Microlunatus sp.]